MPLSRHDDLSLRYLATNQDQRELPMVVMIHGRGADMNDLADLAPMLDPLQSFRFVFPNAPKPFEAYPGMSFGWTWFEGWPPEHESVVESRTTLLRFLGEVMARHPTPAGGLIMAGFSQGALMALDAGLRLDSVAGIIAMSGGLYEADLPDLRKHAGLPVLLAHGSLDDVVPVNYARRARHLLEEAGLEVDYAEYPMGHQVAAEEVAQMKEFLERVLG